MLYQLGNQLRDALARDSLPACNEHARGFSNQGLKFEVLMTVLRTHVLLRGCLRRQTIISSKDTTYTATMMQHLCKILKVALVDVACAIADGC